VEIANLFPANFFPATDTSNVQDNLDLKRELSELIQQAVSIIAPDQHSANITLERPKQAEHGDYACSIAMQLAKLLKRNPREVAKDVIGGLAPSPYLEKAEIAGPGFINLFLTSRAKQQVVRTILRMREPFGRRAAAKPEKINVEFVSANPTGPLHVGHGRQAALGDAISTLLQSQGHHVSREFYYNDAGNQIANLGISVRVRIKQQLGEKIELPEDGYRGDYIVEIAQRYVEQSMKDRHGEDLRAITTFAVQELRKEQDRDLQAFGVKFDTYYLESSLYTDGKVEKTVVALQAGHKTYDQDGALWLKTTDYGDDKDRVMRKSDGTYTYFVPDVAYHVSKWERGYRHAINVQGADHHSTTTRVRAGLQALEMGIPHGYPDYVLHQMVTVMRGKEEVKISKRAGSYVTVRDLIDAVGRDAVRYFFLMRKADSQLIFDIDLARSQSEDNPVYYVQYAHARICSVFSKWGGEAGALADANLTPLTGAYEMDLLQVLYDYPGVVADAAAERAPHLITYYLKDLAGKLHSYYNAEQFLVADEEIKLARLALIAATRQVLCNGLGLLGVTAPEKM
jgi:arginyl-tRNA synthetase